jgi:hypothetical protein
MHVHVRTHLCILACIGAVNPTCQGQIRHLAVQEFVTCPSNLCPRRTDAIRSVERRGIGRNFLLSKENPEIKVPRCCRGHVRLNHIVWEFSLVPARHAIVRFLTLKKLFAKDITVELEGVYGHEAFSAVKKWHNPFINGNHPERRPMVGKTAAKRSLRLSTGPD